MNGFDKMNKKLLASQVEDALMDDILNKPVPIETVKSLVSKGI